MANLYRPTYTYEGETRESGIWWYSAYRNGKRIRRSTGKRDKAEARQVMHQQLGADKLPPKPSGLTLRELRDLVEQDYKLNGQRSLRRALQSFKALEAHFGKDEKASAITTQRVRNYAEKRLDEGYAPATVNKDFAALRRGFSLAVEQELYPPSAVPTIKALQLDNVRKHFVTQAQMAKIAKALDAELRPLAYAGYLTGWRLRELLSRRWKHLDLEGGWLRLAPGETKNRKGRQFPLTPHLRKVFEVQERKAREVWELEEGEAIDPERPLFFRYDGPMKGRAIRSHYKQWNKATEKVGLGHIVFHDLRRSCVKQLVASGVPETVAMRLTGHKTRHIFDRYAIVSEDELLQAADMLHEYVESKKPPKNRSKESKNGGKKNKR